MAAICISNCVDDVPRPTYVNLYKWPESDAEFVRSVSSGQGQPRVVNCISCRQMYLRSYTFSRRESMPEITRKCLGKAKKNATITYRRESKNIVIIIKALTEMISTKSCLVLSKEKQESSAVFLSLFHRFGRESKNIVIIIKALADMISTKSCLGLSKAKQASYAAILSLFHRFLSCTGHKS